MIRSCLTNSLPALLLSAEQEWRKFLLASLLVLKPSVHLRYLRRHNATRWTNVSWHLIWWHSGLFQHVCLFWRSDHIPRYPGHPAWWWGTRGITALFWVSWLSARGYSLQGYPWLMTLHSQSWRPGSNFKIDRGSHREFILTCSAPLS